MSDAADEIEPEGGAEIGELGDLEAADAAYRDAVQAVEAAGEERLERLAEAQDRFTSLLDRYEDRASGTGQETFQAYLEFEEKLLAFVEELPEGFPERESFEEAADALDRRRLDQQDFERARSIIEPVAERTAILEEREEARDRYRRARRAARDRLDAIEGAIDDIEETMAFADADLDAPVDELGSPLQAYNEAVREAFRDFRAHEPARDVLEFVRSTRAFPLVPFDPVPDPLYEHLVETPAGDDPIPELLEYADFTRSKLSHYVDDPAAFRATVGANRTYLERLDATPLTVEWPPPPADELRWRLRELVAVVGRFAPSGVVSKLHTVREAVHDRERYETLRTAARAREELSAEERERVESGALERELDTLREERAALLEALREYPDR